MSSSRNKTAVCVAELLPSFYKLSIVKNSGIFVMKAIAELQLINSQRSDVFSLHLKSKESDSWQFNKAFEIRNFQDVQRCKIKDSLSNSDFRKCHDNWKYGS